MTRSIWSGFHKKTLRERQEQVRLIFPSLDLSAVANGGLSGEIADLMVENCIGVMGLPLGLMPGLMVNGVEYVVPMAVEEPSVIAAASASAKLISAAGGFRAKSAGSVMIGQIQILELENAHAAAQIIEANAARLIERGNVACASMRRRGGGVVGLVARVLAPNVIVHVHIDVREAMGANVVNAVAEAIAPDLADLTGGRIGLRILTNLCLERLTHASFTLPASVLERGELSGEDVARRIVEAQQFATDDPFRACTHNKGIMNGVDAVAIATGQDWRAIEAAAHAYASRNGSYAAMTDYRYDEETRTFSGELTLPLSVGTKGGALQTHPTYRLTHGLLGNVDSATLAQIMVCAGLAQNLAALRALTTEGIQRGHMALHARNVAIAAGAPTALVPEVARYMEKRSRVSTESAREYLAAHQIFASRPADQLGPLGLASTLSIEVELPDESETASLDIAFPTLLRSPEHISMRPDTEATPLQLTLFGDKGEAWIRSAFAVLNQVRLTSAAPSRENAVLQTKLKLASILLNNLLYRLVHVQPEAVRAHRSALRLGGRLDLRAVPIDVPELAWGLPLARALLDVLDHHLDQRVGSAALASMMRQEQNRIIDGLLAVHDETTIESLIATCSKRWQATMILLCDAVSISPSHLSDERIAFITELGAYFEREGIILHDAARWEQATQRGVPNLYRTWLSKNGLPVSGQHVRAFLEAMWRENEPRSRRILEQKESAEFFDARRFVGTVDAIRAHYAL